MQGRRNSPTTFSERIRRTFDWHSSGKLLVYCSVAGCLAGLAAAGLYAVLQDIQSAVRTIYPSVGITLPVPQDYTAAAGPMPGHIFDNALRKDNYGWIVLPRYWILIPLIPALGGLFCGFLIRSFAPEAGGEGTDHIIKSFHARGGTLRNRVPVTKMLTSFLTLGTGGSAGFEGPVTLFGGWIAHLLSQGLQLNSRDRRTLLLAGAAGGIGGLFQIPIGGAFFAVEVLYASSALEFSAILPCILSSVVGYSVFQKIHGTLRPADLPATVGIHSPFDSLMFLLFIPVIALAGLIFVTLIRELRHRVFRQLPVPDLFKPALGGFLLGCLALICPQVLGGGYEWMHRLMHNGLPFALIALLIVPKMLATALTVSSGGSGGLFAPSLLIGGLLGGTLGHAAHFCYNYFGVSAAPPDITTCVLVGMSAFFAGIAKLPFAAAVIVCETADFHYAILIPLIVLNLLHLAIQSPSTSLHEEQVPAPIDSEAHFGNYSIDLLQVLTVKEAMKMSADALTIPRSMLISEAVKLIAPKPESAFPVVDSGGKFAGLVYANDIWGALQHWGKWRGQSVWDLTNVTPAVLSPETDLYTALRTCILEHADELPVIVPEKPDTLAGMLRKSDILAVYNDRLAAAQWR